MPLPTEAAHALRVIEEAAKEQRAVPAHLRGDDDACDAAHTPPAQEAASSPPVSAAAAAAAAGRQKALLAPRHEEAARRMFGAVTADAYYAELSAPAVLGNACAAVRSTTRAGLAPAQDVHRERLHRWVDKVNGWVCESKTVVSEVNTLRKKLDSLVEINTAVKEQSTFLSSQASSLITASEDCQQLCNGVEERLKHFAAVDRLSNEFKYDYASLDPKGRRFKQLLSDIDSTMTFLSNNSHFKSSTQYLSRMHVTQQKALVLLREQVISGIQSVTAEVQKDPRFAAVLERTRPKATWGFSRTPSGADLGAADAAAAAAANGGAGDAAGQATTVSAEELNAGAAPAGSYGLGSVLSIAFRGRLHDMAPLVASLEERCAGEGSGVFLQDAMDTYVQARLSVLTPMFHDFIAPHLAGGVESKELVNIVAHGTTYLLAMAADEMDLFHHFWQGSGQKVGSPKQIIDAVALVLYDAFRSTVLQEEDMSDLCNIIHTLNNAVLARLLASGDAGKLLAPTLSHMCQDAQERLIFRASMRIKDRIAPFTATQQECLTYTQPFGAAAAAAAAAVPDGALAPRPEATQPQYFPVLTDSLQLLSAVYNLVDKGVFSVLAQETIKACMANLMNAAQAIKAAPRATLPTAELDSRLFLVRHLLQLREQISPFEVNFQVTEKRVDLTNIRHNEISVAATQHDTKKELEGQLEQGCKQYITVASHYAGAAIVRFSKLLQERAKDPLGSTEPLGTLVELVSTIVPRSGGGAASNDLPLRPGASSGTLSGASEEASQQQQQQEASSAEVDADAMLPEPSQDADAVVVPQNPNAERGMKKLKQVCVCAFMSCEGGGISSPIPIFF